MLRDLRKDAVARVHQVGVRLLQAAADAPPQLVELGEAQLVGLVDHDRVHVRDVEAGLDDRRADQHVELAVREALHHALQQPLRHLPVADDDARLRHELAHALREIVDRLHAVVQHVGLPAAFDLEEQRLAHDRVVPLGDVGVDGPPALGRVVHRRHVADTGQRHVQRARDRRGGERQHVDLQPHPLQPFLVGDAEALLLVDHDEAEVLELHARVEQAVGADHDVDLARLQPGQHVAGLGVGAEA